MARRIAVFLVLAALAAGIQAARVLTAPVVDMGMWADQANFVRYHILPQEFDFNGAYGHPGGPTIEGTVLFNVLGLTAANALALTMTLVDGAAIAGVALLCVALRKDWWWAAGAFVALSLHASFAASTPTSIMVAYPLVFLMLLTVYLYERDDASWRAYALWAFVAGMALATRTDIGGALGGAYGLLLLVRRGVRRAAALALGAFVSFCAFDPFMWFMPVRHIGDLAHKIIYHYADYPTPTRLPLATVAEFSAFLGLSVLLALVYLACRKRATPPLPVPFLVLMVSVTGLLYDVFLTATYQAERYFFPLLLSWEALLPLFLFSFYGRARFSFVRTERGQLFMQRALRIATLLLLAAYPILFIYRYYVHPAYV